jgi:hypothetical protein
MIQRELQDLVRREPFEPFRIKLVNGDAHDVHFADLVALLKRGVQVASEHGHWAIFPYGSIASLESVVSDFQGGPPAG